MTAPLRFGLKNSGQATTIQALRDVWRIADEAGFDHVWDFDHLASIGSDGTERPIYEGWTLLAAIAASTRRVRFGCMVTGNTYRHPVLLAKMAVTIDHLSGGRLEFGIGAAWAEAEHQMFGIEGLDHRVGRLRESLEAIISLWTKERTTLDGRDRNRIIDQIGRYVDAGFSEHIINCQGPDHARVAEAAAEALPDLRSVLVS